MGRTACTEPQCLYKFAIYILHFNLPTRIGSPTVGWGKLDAMCFGVNWREVASKLNVSD